MARFLESIDPSRWYQRQKRNRERKKQRLELDKKRQEPFVDLEPEFWPYHDHCKPFTMTCTERIYALYKAVQYLTAHEVPGDFVECGVWKGGSAMLCAMMLAEDSSNERSLCLYDTFEGMAEPGEQDVYLEEAPAKEVWPP